MIDTAQLSDRRPIVRFLTGNWPSIATIITLAAAVTAWVALSSNSSLEAMGSYISGVVSAITLLWLAIGQKHQLTELALQRQELALQRAAAQQQALELHDAARIAAMTQIQSLVDDAVEIVRASGLVDSETQLLQLYMSGIEYWKDIEESSNPTRVISASNEWIKREGICKRYLNSIAAAMKLHQEINNPEHKIPTDKESEEVVYVYQPWVKNAPFISDQIGVAAVLAQFVMMLKPGSKRAMLATMVAHAKSLKPGIFIEGKLNEMRDEELARAGNLPKICDPWPQ